MKNRLFILILLGNLGLQAQIAYAVVACNLSSPGWSSVYDSTVVTPNDNTSTVTITCTRALTDPATQAYVLQADNGLNKTGTSNQALQTTGTGLISYNEYMDAAYTTVWGGNTTFTGTINFGTGTVASAIIPFYARIPAGQLVAAADYSDTITMTLTNGLHGKNAVTFAIATHPVLISTIPQCQISTPPGNIVFTYTSFQAAAATASTTFATRCTSALPYTMSLDADTPLLGLTYTLSLPVTAGSGTGLAQTYTINGSITAGQSGTCGTATCTGTAIRTLTVSF